VQHQGHQRPPGAVIIRARSAGLLACYCLGALWVLALIASAGAQSSSGGQLEAVVVFGAFLLVTAGGGIAVSRRRRQLEVGRDAIVSRRGRKDRSPLTLTREPGDTLRILPPVQLYGLVRQQRLIFLGRGGFIFLGGFSLDAVKRACAAQGWRFDGAPGLAAEDVRSWLHRGRSVEAVQLLQLFGPFPAAEADGEPHTGLAAAVFEDVGDKLASGRRGRAQDVYRQAAAAQRAFAGCAGRGGGPDGCGRPDRGQGRGLASRGRRAGAKLLTESDAPR
jgi:hypothetical protein